MHTKTVLYFGGEMLPMEFISFFFPTSDIFIFFSSNKFNKMLLSIALTAAALSGLPAGWTSNVVYRVTPVNYTGLVNMDSSNAAGDVMFGLNQLLLPFMCPLKPDFLWCQNRQYLSGGAAHMVYSKFNLQSKNAFGDYAACNPDPVTGVFGCTHFTNVSGLPKQCRNNYYVSHFDCYNGTVYKEINVQDMGDCCSACSDDHHCEGWNMPDVNGTNCQLLTDPIVDWGSARTVNPKCTSAQKMHNDEFTCWYDDPTYNVTFAPYCSRSECNCRAVGWLSVGRQHHPMCFQSSEKRSNKVYPIPDLSETSDKAHNYWKCNELLFQQCADTITKKEHCLSCAKRSSLENSCDKTVIDALCSTSLDVCNSTVVSSCGMTDVGTCRECAFSEDVENRMMSAHCNSSLVNEACINNAPPNKGDQYENWMLNFGCMMNGTWYSTTDDGYCNGTITDDCWWNVDEAIRTVNQTCVDGNVVNSVYNHNSTCFQSCPQPHNISTNCVVDCLYTNIFGEDGGIPMKPSSLTDAFLKSFTETDPAKGGCPEVHVPPPADN